VQPSVTIPAFDSFLAERGLRLEAILIGGAALNLLGVVQRETRDCDVLAPPLPAEILAAARDFARARRVAGEVLRDEWLNNGPEMLTRQLPAGWEQRAEPLFSGRALVLHTLGRADLLKTKLFAFCDRRTDLADCLALAPTSTELSEALPWVEAQDANEQWPGHVRQLFGELGRRLGHGV